MLHLAPITRLQMSLVVLGFTFVCGVSSRPSSMPIVEWVGIWKPPLVAVIVGEPPSPRIALFSVCGVRTGFRQTDQILRWMGLLDQPRSSRAGRKWLAIARLEGRVLRRLDERGSGDVRCWMSSSGNRIVWRMDDDWYTCALPWGEVRELEEMRRGPLHVTRHTECRVSTNGRAAVFATAVSLCEERALFALYWMDFATGSVAYLGPCCAPSFVSWHTVREKEGWVRAVCDISADGSKVVYAGSENGEQVAALYLCDPRSGETARLTDESGCEESWPAFVPHRNAVSYFRRDPAREIAVPPERVGRLEARAYLYQLVWLELPSKKETAFDFACHYPSLAAGRRFLPSCFFITGSTQRRSTVAMFGYLPVSAGGTEVDGEGVPSGAPHHLTIRAFDWRTRRFRITEYRSVPGWEPYKQLLGGGWIYGDRWTSLLPGSSIPEAFGTTQRPFAWTLAVVVGSTGP
jgi:hypothetical protein